MFPYYIPKWNDPKESFIKKKETELMVQFKSSGGQIHVYGADRPDLLRGPNPQGVVLDEFSVQKPQIWTDIVQPIVRANPTAWVWFLATPRGKNHFFEVFQYGQEERAGEWKSWKLTVEDSGIFDPTQIQNMRATSTAQTFAQEYMCEFLEGEGSVFRGVREICTAIPQPKQDGHHYVMGVDVAKHVDYTVIAVYDRQGNQQVYQDRFQRFEWPFQKEKIRAVSKLYNDALVILDSTGQGDPIFDDLARFGVPIQPFKFTGVTKKDLIEKLSIFIEHKQLRMINMAETLFEFDNFQFEVLPSGLTRYGAPEGFHDDIVIAHALAIHGLHPISYKPAEPPKTLIQKAYERARTEHSIDDNLTDWGNF